MAHLKEARPIYDTAQGWDRATSILSTAFHTSGAQVVAQSITCQALSIELYFKTLLVLESGSFTRIHSFVDLFKALSPESKTYIEQKATEISSHLLKDIKKFTDKNGLAPHPDFDFHAMLAAGSNIFLHWRYTFTPNPRENFMAKPFVGALKSRIHMLVPSWEERRA